VIRNGARTDRNLFLEAGSDKRNPKISPWPGEDPAMVKEGAVARAPVQMNILVFAPNGSEVALSSRAIKAIAFQISCELCGARANFL
jgi:hypothetical protein